VVDEKVGGMRTAFQLLLTGRVVREDGLTLIYPTNAYK